MAISGFGEQNCRVDGLKHHSQIESDGGMRKQGKSTHIVLCGSSAEKERNRGSWKRKQVCEDLPKMRANVSALWPKGEVETSEEERAQRKEKGGLRTCTQES